MCSILPEAVEQQLVGQSTRDLKFEGSNLGAAAVEIKIKETFFMKIPTRK